MVSQILLEDPPSLTTFIRRPPRDLETIVLKCMDKVPARRYASARELADDLRRYLSGNAIHARPVGRLNLAWRWCKRRPTTAVLLTALATVIVAATTALSISHLRTLAALRSAEEQAYYNLIATANGKWLVNEIPRGSRVLDECPEDERRFEWWHLKRLFGTSELQLRHTNGVFAVSPDGQEICTDCDSRPGLQFFDAHTGELLRRVVDGQQWVRSLEYSLDGTMLVCCVRENGSLCLRSAKDGKLIRSLSGHQRSVREAHFIADGSRIVSWGLDRDVCVWDTATGELVSSVTTGRHEVRWIAVSPAGNRIAASVGRAERNSLTIWDAITGQIVEELPVVGGPATGLAFSPDGQVLAASEAGGAIRFWQFEPLRLGLVIPGPVSDYPHLTFDRAGRRLAAETPDGTIRIWDTADGRELLALRGNDPPCTQLQFSPDAARLLVGGDDPLVRCWNITSQQGTLAIPAGTAPVVDLDFGPQGESIAGILKDGTVGKWNTADGSRMWTLPADVTHANSVDVASDGLRLAIAGDDCAVRILDAQSGDLIRCFREHERPVRVAVFSPDGKQVASGGMGRRVRIWETATGQVIRTLSLATGEIRALAFHPTRGLLAVGTRDGKASVWDLATGKMLWYSSEPPCPVWDVAWAPDGLSLAVSRRDGRVVLHDPLTGTCTRAMGYVAHEAPVHIAFSPEGDRLAVASARLSLTLWAVPSARSVLELRRDSIVSGAVAFDPTGRIIASGQTDGTIVLWLSDQPPSE